MDSLSQSNRPEENGQLRQPLPAESIFLSPGGRLRPIFRSLLFFLGVFVVNIEVGGIVFRATRDASLWIQLFWSSLALVVAFLLLSWVFLRLLDGKRLTGLRLTFRRGWGWQLAGGFAIGVGMQVLIGAIFLATHAVHFSLSGSFDFQFWKRVAANALLFALAATVEELSFRGYGFQRLIDSIGAGGAVVATSILFGVLHMGNPNATFFSTMNTVLAGILLALPYVRTRTMWMQIGLHWSWNFTMAALISLPVSGLNFGPGVFRAQDAGPNWFTGGRYGPEGGAVVTAVTLLAIVWFLMTRRLTPSPETQEDLQ